MNAGKSWEPITQGLTSRYTIPLLIGSPDSEKIFTAAAMGPPPTWRAGPAGPDAILFRSDDRGESFTAVSDQQGFGRGMLMRVKSDPQKRGALFSGRNEGGVLPAPATRSLLRHLP